MFQYCDIYVNLLQITQLCTGRSNGRIEYEINEVSYLNRDEIKIISVEKFNFLANTNYKSVQELYFNPLKFEEELVIRQKIEISLKSKTYDDVREKIVAF